MEAIALCYHDILCGKHPDASGFPGPVAASYKLDEADFRAHMRAIAWGMGERADALMADAGRCCLAFTPRINEWNGYRAVELEVADFQPGARARLG